MNKKILNQLIAAALVCGTVLAAGVTPANAAMKTENGKTYYYNELGQKVTGWIFTKNGKCYMNEKGEMQKNITMKDATGRDVKLCEDGIAEGTRPIIAYGGDFKTENGKDYYLNESGQKTGWVGVDGKMYYYNEKGEMQKDTTVKDLVGKEVKLSKNGAVMGEHGYELIYGEEVTYDSSEAYKNSQKHWKKVGNDWYCYFGDDLKHMVSGAWWQENGVWYYFNDKGIMQNNTTIKDDKGNDCVLNSDGALTNRSEPERIPPEEGAFSWKEVDGNWYYMAPNGDKETGWVKSQTTGKWYYCNKDGVMQKNTTIIDHDIKYVFDVDGAWIK